MKKIFHKNQVIITTLAFLIAIAGYISYDKATEKGEKTVPTGAGVASAEETAEKNTTFEISLVDGTESAAVSSTEVSVAVIDDTEEISNPGEAVLTNALPDNIESAAELKLSREQVRSKNKEALNAIIANESLTDEQRQSAVDELVRIADIAEKEADAEMTLEAKGFTNVVVNMDDSGCDVILDMGEVTDARCAQVEDIVKRKTGVSADKIIITPVSGDEAAALEQ